MQNIHGILKFGLRDVMNNMSKHPNFKTWYDGKSIREQQSYMSIILDMAKQFNYIQAVQLTCYYCDKCIIEKSIDHVKQLADIYPKQCSIISQCEKYKHVLIYNIWDIVYNISLLCDQCPVEEHYINKYKQKTDSITSNMSNISRVVGGFDNRFNNTIKFIADKRLTQRTEFDNSYRILIIR